MKNNVEVEKLKLLLDYELFCSIRYRRFMSLLLCEKEQEDHGDEPLVEYNQYFRECDQIFQFGEDTIVVMPETDLVGAQKALQRLKQAATHNGTKYTLVSFPQDGKTAKALLDKAQKDLCKKFDI